MICAACALRFFSTPCLLRVSLRLPRLRLRVLTVLNLTEQGAQSAAADPGPPESEGGFLTPHDGSAYKAAPF